MTVNEELRIAVFCASRPGTNPKFTAAAESLANALYSKNWSLVYGGGNRGLMGSVAGTLFAKGGKVHGIIPRALIRREVVRTGALQISPGVLIDLTRGSRRERWILGRLRLLRACTNGRR